MIAFFNSTSVECQPARLAAGKGPSRRTAGAATAATGGAAGLGGAAVVVVVVVAVTTGDMLLLPERPRRRGDGEVGEGLLARRAPRAAAGGARRGLRRLAVTTGELLLPRDRLRRSGCAKVGGGLLERDRDWDRVIAGVIGEPCRPEHDAVPNRQLAADLKM
jgi:hypothetical protein